MRLSSTAKVAIRTSAVVGFAQTLFLASGLAISIVALTAKDASAHKFATIFDGFGGKYGDEPQGLSIDQSGNLYGVTEADGSNHQTGYGTIYELVQGKRFKLLYTLCEVGGCPDGARPAGPPIIDTAGNLYVATSQGGAHGDGSILKLSPGESGWTSAKLYDFCSQGGATCTDGAGPEGGLTYTGAAGGLPYDGSSPLYGAASGGTSGRGVVYALTPGQSGWTETVLHDFCPQAKRKCIDGFAPRGNLFLDAQGNLFGTTRWGGTNYPNGVDYDQSGAGLIFRLSPNGDSWTETVLYNFCNLRGCKDGAAPFGSLIPDASGALLGTTSLGGEKCTLNGNDTTCGTLFKLSPDGNDWQETVLHAFCKKSDCSDGAEAIAGLVLDSSGNLFGTTGIGGGNDIDQDHVGGGVVFEMRGTSYKVLYRFCSLANCADGEYPRAGLVEDATGVLFGTTAAGGVNNRGAVFKLKP